MDYIEVTHHDYMAKCLQGPCDFVDMTQYHWKSDVLRETRGYHRRNEKTHIQDNIFFTLNDDYVELSNSVIEVEPEIELLPNMGGQAKTLVMTCNFRIPNIRITGKICILNVSNVPIASDYVLRLNNIEISSIVGFHISGDSYIDDYFKHKFEKANVSLTYKDGSQMISLLDKVTDKSTKLLLENYILEKCTKEIFSAMQDILLKPLYDKGCVSNSVGGDYCLRNMFRLHEKKFKAAFNIFVNKIVDITNQLIKENSPTILLSKIFEISKSKDKPDLKVYKGVVRNLNTLVKGETPIILPENDVVLMYVPIDFNNLHIKYEDGVDNKEECFKTSDSYFKITLKKLDTEKVQINLLECKIKEFKFSSKSEINLILDYQISLAIEEELKKYLILALKKEELNILAINPPNVEIDYDSDDFMGDDSEED